MKLFKKHLSLIFALSLITAASVSAMQPAPVAAKVAQNVASQAPVAAQAAQDVWAIVQANGKEILTNLWAASCNVFSLVPYVLKQVTYETKVVSEALPKTPLLTAGLMCAAGFGAYKLWSYFKDTDAYHRVEDRVHQVHERFQRRV